MPTFPFFCGKDCGGDACALLATVEDGQVTRIQHNPAGGEFLQGCRRGFDQPLFHHSPERLLKPLIRSGERGSGQFREATWDEALDLTAQRLGEIRAKYGANRRAQPVQRGRHRRAALHLPAAAALPQPVRRSNPPAPAATAPARPASSCLTCLAATWAAPVSTPATMQQAEMIILWGANLLETRMGSQMPHRLSQARASGSADRRDRSAPLGHGRRPPPPGGSASRPGTDAALMLAVLYVLFARACTSANLPRRAALGMDQLERYVLGLDGGTAHSRPGPRASAACPPRRSPALPAHTPPPARPCSSRATRSSACMPVKKPIRLAVALQLATGNSGKLGGSTGSLNNLLPGPRVGGSPCLLPRSRRPPLSCAGPTWCWKAARAGTRAISTPSTAWAATLSTRARTCSKSIAAFQKVDFAVCHDLFLTPTARMCDVVFPAASAFEKEDIGIPWLGNYLLYRPQIFPPPERRAATTTRCAHLAERLGFGAQFSEGRSEAEWVQRFLDQSEIPDQAEFRRTGIYEAEKPLRAGLDDFCADPAAHPLDTPSGKIEIASQRFARDTGLPAIPTWMPPPADPRYPLRLVTPKSPYLHALAEQPARPARARRPRAGDAPVRRAGARPGRGPAGARLQRTGQPGDPPAPDARISSPAWSACTKGCGSSRSNPAPTAAARPTCSPAPRAPRPAPPR